MTEPGGPPRAPLKLPCSKIRVPTTARFGQPRHAIDRLETGEWHKPQASMRGGKANLSDVHAAIGLEQLKKFPAMRRDRLALATAYDIALAKINTRVGFGAYEPLMRNGGACPHMYVIKVGTPLLRDKVAGFLVERGVQVQVHYRPVPFHPYWQEKLAPEEHEFPVCRQMMPRVLSLPFWPGMTVEMLEYVCRTLEEAAGGRS